MITQKVIERKTQFSILLEVMLRKYSRMANTS